MRRTPLKRHPKSKGTRGEKEVQEILRQAGYERTKRNLGSGAQGGGDLIESIPGHSIEIKRVERLNVWAALAQCEAAASPTETPLLVFRRNRSRWYACVPLDDYLPLVEASQL